MSRPTFEEIYMRFAVDIAKRSTCERKQVGCVIVSDDFTKVLGIGYNGNYKNGPNKCDDKTASGACGCLHAEDNALLKCGGRGRKIMFCTLQPCTTCAKRIINKGEIGLVYYKESYKTSKGTTLLKENGIKVEKL